MLDTKKHQELELIELLEDLPEYGRKKGDIGVVVEVFDVPDEAYDLEFVDESGESEFAYSVKPSQIRSAEEAAKEIFERGIALLNQGKQLEAEKEFRQAIHLKPDYLSVLHNSIVKSFEGSHEWQEMITAMSIVFRINPEYEIARRNLSIAYQNYGIEKSKQRDYGSALDLFHTALSLSPPVESITDIKNSLAALFTEAGIYEQENGRMENTIRFMREAYAVSTNEITKRNMGVAYAHLMQFSLVRGDFNKALLAFENTELAGVVSAELLNSYGVALANLQRFDEAIWAFERALVMQPEDEIIQHNLRLAKNDATTNYSTEEIDINFSPIPIIQPQEYSLAA